MTGYQSHLRMYSFKHISVLILTVWLIAVGGVRADISRKYEQTALDGLLAITEAQTRFAVRNGRYANSISELGLQTSVMSAGQLTMKAAYDADFDSPKRIAADGYLFRVLPVRGQASGDESNSFWAVAIPDSGRNDLPIYVTAAHRVRTITFPLVNWWALRLHDRNRLRTASMFTTQPAISTQDISLNPEVPETFPNAFVVRRFLLDPNVNYPSPEQPQPPAIDYRIVLVIGGIVVVVLILLLSRKPKSS